MTALSADELARFWALGISLEADYVPEDEWLRAIAEKRVQAAVCSSSMGTAETGWMHVTIPSWNRDDCAVVPPGQIAESTEWNDMQDDRDVVGVCWGYFWATQRTVALATLSPDHHAAVLEECARMLVELEQAWTHDRDNPNRRLLVDWLISANALPPEQLETELADIKSSALGHLVRGVRARWLVHDVEIGFDAVLASARRGKEDYYRHGNVAHERRVRMRLLRFIVGLAR